MGKDTELKISYDNLLRRVRLLGIKKHQTSNVPVSFRLTTTESNLVDNMGEIFGLNRSTIIRMCIQGAAQSLAEDESSRRLNKIFMGE